MCLNGHIPIPVFSEGIDPDQVIILGGACAVCGEVLSNQFLDGSVEEPVLEAA